MKNITPETKTEKRKLRQNFFLIIKKNVTWPLSYSSYYSPQCLLCPSHTLLLVSPYLHLRDSVQAAPASNAIPLLLFKQLAPSNLVSLSRTFLATLVVLSPFSSFSIPTNMICFFPRPLDFVPCILDPITYWLSILLHLILSSMRTGSISI